MTDTDVAAIAAGLTRAQRELLIEGGPCVVAYRPCQALIRLCLWSDDDGEEYAVKGEKTPLGLAVRQHLLSAQQSERGE